MPVELQVIIIFVATNKYLLDIPVEWVTTFESEFLEFVQTKYSEIPNDIRETKEVSDQTAELLKKAIAEFKSGFLK